MQYIERAMSKDYFSKYHIFRDPIHGFIKVYDVERDIINSKAFQRLRRIKQLGPTNFIYHGADHTRFAHSIGVMGLADRVFDIIVSKGRQDKLLKWKQKDIKKNRVLLRLVALLHDIGHAPFSHVGEKELFPNGFTHKDFSRKIITEDQDIRSIIDNLKGRFEITSERIADFIIKKEPNPPILQQIVDGPLDVDKMDYLWRDSYYTGVHYGRFDLDRLVHTLVVVFDKVRESPSLGIEEGGVCAAEALIFARYYMFLQVYFHAVRRVYDLHFTQFIKTILPHNIYPIDLNEYLKLDDTSIIYKIKEEASSNGKNKELAEMLLYRHHFENIYETADQTGDKEKLIFEQNRSKIEKKFSSIKLLTDRAEDATNKFKKELFYVRLRNPKSKKEKYKEIDKMSKIISRLEEINKFRLYAPQDNNLRRVEEFCRKLDWEP